MTLNNEHLGEYYGNNLSGRTCDALMAFCVPASQWDAISELYETKWYGYRFLSPGQSLLVFADRFRKAYREVAGKYYGTTIHRRPFLKDDCLNLSSSNMLQKRDVTALWKAMCHADIMGTPYDLFCEQSIMVAIKEGWTYLPRPSQIYCQRVLFAIQDRWEEMRKARLIFTGAPQFKASNFTGHKWQKAYCDGLIETAMKRDKPIHALAEIIFKEGQIPREYALQKVGAEMLLASAKSYRDFYS